MISIRRYLTLWLALGVLGSCLIAIIITMFSAKHEVDELYDAHLKQIARTLYTQIEHSSLHEKQPENWASDPNKTYIEKEEDYLIQLWHRDDLHGTELIYSSYPAIIFPLQTAGKIHSTVISGVSWRYYTTELDDGWIQVAQPTHTRGRMLFDVLKNILFPLILQLPFLAWLIWYTVRRSLQPLGQISDEIQARQPDSLTPIEIQSIPSEVQTLVGALNNLLDRLSRALQAQRRFTADAAHELRTPLTALQLQLDVLRMANTQPERNRAIEQLGKGIDRSIRLVRQLLTLARLEPSNTTISPQQVRLDLIARQTIELHAQQSIKQQIDLGLSANHPVTIHGNEDSLITLLNNLIDNAIHYTPAGGKVDVLIGQVDSGSFLRVEDNGPGIPKADQSRIFDRFYRVLGTKKQGTGLGLSIVKAIADEHGASITLDSDESGTRISVFFPAHE